MAQGLPFFKFEIDSYQNGNIQFCSYESQGLFINICTIYWSRKADLTKVQAMRRLCRCQADADAFEELINSKIVKIEQDKIVIKFLDEQLYQMENKSNQAKDAANKRWKKEKQLKKPKNKDLDADAMRMHSESNANRIEQNRTEHNKKEEKQKGFISIMDLNYNPLWREELFKTYNIGPKACRNYFNDWQEWHTNNNSQSKTYEAWKQTFFDFISKKYTPKCPNPMLR